MGFHVYRVIPGTRRTEKVSEETGRLEGVVSECFFAQERVFRFWVIPWGWRTIHWSKERDSALATIEHLMGKRAVFENRQGDIVEVVSD